MKTLVPAISLFWLAAVYNPVIASDPCIGDLDDSGEVGVGDLNRMLSFWAESSLGDLNGDFRTDVEDLNILLGDWGCTSPGEPGVLFEGRVYDVCVGYQWGGMFNPDLAAPGVGDVNGDGFADVIARDGDGCDGFGVLLGGPDRSLTTLGTYSVAGEFRYAIVEDLDGDGLLDAVIGTADNGVWTFRGDGTGGMAPIERSAPGAHISMAASDFNGDGVTDLATADGQRGVSILTGRGDGTLSITSWIAMMGRPIEVAAADIDADGDADLIVARRDSGDLLPVLNRGPAGFATDPPIVVGSIPHALRLADFNGDGAPDILVAATGQRTARVLLNDGRGSFGTPAVTAFPEVVKDMVPFDADSDGDLDVTAMTGSGRIYTLMNDRGVLAEPVGQHFVGAGGSARSIAIGDADGDEITDLIVSGDYLRVLYLDEGARPELPRVAAAGIDTPRCIRWADLNLDGIADAVIGGSGVTVQHGDTYGLSLAQAFAAPADCSAIAVGDFNADGLPDFAATHDSALALHYLFINRGDGTFDQSLLIGSGQFARALEAIDLDADGDLDLVAANLSSDDLTVWRNDGGGGLTFDRSIPVGPRPIAMSAADVDADGVTDLALALWADDSVRVLKGDGAGGFVGSGAVYSTAHSQPDGVLLADINGDGYPDLFVSNFESGAIGLRLNLGNGNFGSMSVLGDPLFEPMTVGDVNGDGFPDFIATQRGSAHVYLNDGHGGLSRAEAIYGTDSYLRSIELRDMDGDGTPDLVTLGSGMDALTYLRGTGGR